MWDMRRNIDPTPMPRCRNTIQLIFNDLKKSQQNWWLIVEPGQEVDLCSVDPGFEVDLYLSTDLRTMTEIWMGYTTVAQAKQQDRLTPTGNRQARSRYGRVDEAEPVRQGEEAGRITRRCFDARVAPRAVRFKSVSGAVQFVN